MQSFIQQQSSLELTGNDKLPTIVIIGSLNMDLITVTDRVPNAGETVHGTSFHTLCGGKGANQAVACARLGAQVHMIGCIGDDNFGQQMLNNLKHEGIDCSGIITIKDQSSGIASITIDDQDNRIIVVPGANGGFRPKHIEQQRMLIQQADLVLMQLEIPMDTVYAAVDIAYEYGVPVMLNPAPAVPLDSEWLKKIAWLTPNEHELAIMLGLQDQVNERSKDGELLGTMLSAWPERIVMTRGGDGALWADAGGHIQHMPGHKVTVVDTTGAGDTFNGALAVSLAEGRSLTESVARSVAAGALSVTRFGAQGGMPTKSDLERYLSMR
ncbi:ribokinase [Paenibacillus sp. 1001270B_150601_E10]|uniref:ribokinase n=1 Tax=Paenibacillus sp. 1001270B_150601_E10 TaxID=2787079 RepID=UPI00226CF474|nr:ribokinase [Paenibacillus sp. 1001270B_150601_E10]